MNGPGITEDRWSKTQPNTHFPGGPHWLRGGTWYRGYVVINTISLRDFVVYGDKPGESVRLLGTSIDWDAVDGGPGA